VTRKEACKILQLSENFIFEDLKTAFRRMALKTHPDKGGSVQAFLQVQAAYEYLLGQGKTSDGAEWQETPDELRQRLRDISDAFDKLVQELGPFLDDKIVAFDTYLINSINNLRSSSEIKKRWSGIVVQGWHEFNSILWSHLHNELKQISSIFDRWLTEKMRLTIELSKQRHLNKKMGSVNFYIPALIFWVLISVGCIYFWMLFQSISICICYETVALIVSLCLSSLLYETNADNRFRLDNLVPRLELETRILDEWMYRYNLTDVITSDESAVGGAGLGAGIGALVGGPFGAILGGILGGFLGGLFGTPLNEIKQAVYNDTVGKLEPELHKQCDQILKGIFELKAKYIKQAEDNFQKASRSAVKLLLEN
jgi:hypothetical protein